ncbi:hypothetical protein C823_003515 [Eubacterium plexicaudatum ASF492]|nr:hypothetical protein C823_003515 [Eubacterium plexicaudatum ASF492]
MAVFQVNFMAETLGRTVPLYVILPTDKVYFPGMKKRAEGKPYQTLYLLHGIIGNYTDWLYGTRIQRWAQERDLAVVMPSGDNCFYLDQPWNCNMYGEFIGKELVSFTRKTFPLSDRKEDTFIGGLSMGGFGAMRNGLKYNRTFGRIFSLSGAFIVDETLLEKADSPRFPAETEEFKHSCFGPDLEAALHSDKILMYLSHSLYKTKKRFRKSTWHAAHRILCSKKTRHFPKPCIRLESRIHSKPVLAHMIGIFGILI